MTTIITVTEGDNTTTITREAATYRVKTIDVQGATIIDLPCDTLLAAFDRLREFLIDEYTGSIYIP